MNKIFKILMKILMMFILIQPVLADSQDYICVDKTETASPPHELTDIDKNIEKAPLCPEDKVPKSITGAIMSIADNGKPIKGFPDYSIVKSATCSYFGACYDWVDSRQYANNLGASAHMTQHNPSIDPTYGYHSIAEIGVANSNDGDWPGDYVEVGWRKANGDLTRLFTFWWKNGVPQCYNSGCGWVQVSNYYYPGMTLSPNTIGADYRIEYNQGNWWMAYNGIWFGYYPGNLWNGQFNQGNLVLYYGEIASSVSRTTTDMGNGLWASNTSAARIDSEGYKNLLGSSVNANTIKYASAPDLYTLVSTSSNSLRYGGPGTGGNPSSITVVSPNNGENWAKGTTKSIKWSYNGVPGPNVKIELLKGGVLNRVISSNLPIGSGGTGSYNWAIPSGQVLGSDYKIKITSTSNSGYTDTSNNYFRIISPITVISPNGGENWTKGITKTISWSSVGNLGTSVKIELIKGGIINRVIISSTPNDGSFSWSIPSTQTIGSDYKIKITSTSNSVYTDTSNNYFRIL